MGATQSSQSQYSTQRELQHFEQRGIQYNDYSTMGKTAALIFFLAAGIYLLKNADQLCKTQSPAENRRRVIIGAIKFGLLSALATVAINVLYFKQLFHSDKTKEDFKTSSAKYSFMEKFGKYISILM